MIGNSVALPAESGSAVTYDSVFTIQPSWSALFFKPLLIDRDF
jgi:hypothetical protein